MSLKLTHLGELLIAEMLSSLTERRKLDRVRCARSKVRLTEDLQTDAPKFLPEKARLCVQAEARTYSCDGAQVVDVLCACNDHAVALEAKLGDTRMTPREFKDRFCRPCEMSKHQPSRLRGRMVAVLDGSLPFASSQVLALVDQRALPVDGNWWLVIRRNAWSGWENCELPVRHAHIVVR
jgi:hypothetical protein